MVGICEPGFIGGDAGVGGPLWEELWEVLWEVLSGRELMTWPSDHQARVTSLYLSVLLAMQMPNKKQLGF